MTQVPKAASHRHRPKPGGATLYAVDPETVEVPPLPPRRIWQAETEEWWLSIHHSPMATEFADADLFHLYHLAELMDDFALAESVKERIELSKEIRIKGQAFGLTPLDRSRLSWEIEKGDQAETQTRARRNRQIVTVEEEDDDAYASLT